MGGGRGATNAHFTPGMGSMGSNTLSRNVHTGLRQGLGTIVPIVPDPFPVLTLVLIPVLASRSVNKS